ncbi:hypothetical protein HELRODRAFT_163344 [Helobdella robusta]|uniref:ABC-type glutathione-S-conjugate transporter n=1 Tax=Helobdella robusta TaxID=6412 RepID=T1ETX8_HELRO|nr:hypothetical protein HELRODRAFT_163344 [Helobdella robusta]ESN96295.1 hypothetical protein HELRODRAFT_163344 [Helobdella robusta]
MICTSTICTIYASTMTDTASAITEKADNQKKWKLLLGLLNLSLSSSVPDILFMKSCCAFYVKENQSLTWDTDYPDLTDCFQSSVLVWLPCSFLLLVAPFYYFFYLKHVRLPMRLVRRGSKLHVAKMIFTSILIILSIISLVHNMVAYVNGWSGWYAVNLVSPAIQIFTLTVSMLLLMAEKEKRLVTSGVHFLFYFLCLIAVLFNMVSIVSRAVRPRKQCPEAQASFLSRMTFFWITGLIYEGYKKTLKESDLWGLHPRDVTRSNANVLQQKWNEEVASCARYNKKVLESIEGSTVEESETTHLSSSPATSYASNINNVIPNVLSKVYGPRILLSHFFKIFCDLLIMVGPQLQSYLISFIETSSTQGHVWKGYLYACLFFFNTLLYSILFQQVFHVGMNAGMRMNASIIALVYKKALTMSSEARKTTTVGEIVNLMSVDSQRLQDATGYLWMVWSSPFQIVLSMYFLYGILGPSIFAGVAVMILFIPINAWVSAVQRKMQTDQMKRKDDRIKLTNEILNGIKVIKLYAWELSFKEKVSAIRNLELVTLKKYSYLGAVILFSWSCAPFLVTLAAFATYVLVGGQLDANKAFTALSLLNILRVPISILPMMISYLVMAAVSVKRIEKYLQTPDLDEKSVLRLNEDGCDENDPDPYSIIIESGTFAWGRGPDDANVLNNINLKIRKKSLTAIVGQVGLGKSSLLSAALGDMEKRSGRVITNGRIGYVSQQAWIENATLRDNILFGKPFDEDKYNQIIEACALKQDLIVLAAGDMTEIGEKGINLSGGQKQRVSLARSIYQDCDVYLFDDPLSAVDSHVAKHIFDSVIGPHGILKNKTRVLVTHGITWLPSCDVVVVMATGGIISECGSYQDLLNHNLVFAQFIRDFLQEEEEEEEENEDGEKDTINGVAGDDYSILSPEAIRADEKSLLERKKEVKKLLRERVNSLISNKEDEDVQQGRKKLSGFDNYDRTSVHSTESDKRSGYSLRKRKKLKPTKSILEEESKNVKIDKIIQEEISETGSVKLSVYWAYIKSLGVLLSSIFIFFFILFNVAALLSNFWLSKWTNDPIIRNASLINGSLPEDYKDKQMFYLGGYAGFGLLQAIFILIYALVSAETNVKSSRVLHQDLLYNILRSPMTFFDTTPIGRILNRFSKDVETRFYIPTTRQLKRLESTTRSPIYVHFSETISGASVIRAFGKQKDFIAKSEKLVDNNMVAYFANITSNRLVVKLTARLSWRHNCCVCSCICCSRKRVFVLFDCWTFNNLCAPKRGKRDPPEEWPDRNNIIFRNYGLRYRPGLELVLKNINIDIKSREKIGIVGRTGAGKSSMTLALFRLIEPSEGSIIIDGVDITSIGLHQLRSKITILPQDPVIFSGSLRFNLDPTNEHSDDQIWTALENAHLKTYVASLPAALDNECGEGGQNLSVGQRQLVCLGRALLHKTGLLVLDEATAAVDLETDKVIQETIRTQFDDCTILTIAHRINTILNCDRVLVMDKGNVMEFDNPQTLLNNKRSLFYGLAKDAKIVP